MQKLLTALLLFLPCATFAADVIDDPSLAEYNEVMTEYQSTFGEYQPVVYDIDPENQNATDTPCASNVFASELAASADDISEADEEHIIQGWIYNAFGDPDVIHKVLACPEIAKVPDEYSIKFSPVEYFFAGGRHIVVNYETQPKILKQRLLVAGKRSLPETNPSPRIGVAGDPTVWTYTEPAWYGILVVQSGTMDQFVGNDKSNTISLKYIEDNIDHFYPKGNRCTSKSALANDNDMINMAVTKTVGVEKDSNDYYVAGDVNLQWISWAEVALDVAITVVTIGGGTVVLGATKAVRASRAAKNLVGTIKTLEKADKVQDYLKLTRQSARAAAELKKIDKATDAARYAAKSDEIADLAKSIKTLDKAEDVVKYKRSVSAFEDVMKYRRALKAWRVPAQTGNVVARVARSLKAINTGNKVIGKGAKAARAGMQSGRIRDWMFQSTIKNVGRLAKMERAGGVFYGAMKFVGGMYDWTETATGDYTNDIKFKPLGLLSADDLEGQTNVVNHGMWLMWVGDSTSAADDDAAYLQVMDFASKFHEDLNQTQEEAGINPCNIDIYVVRPIIRNPGDPDESLYYLIMNDVPWHVE